MMLEPAARRVNRFLGQRGQSLIEFLVLLLVLLPIFVIVPLLGKVTDMKQHAIAASRYVAFEAVARHSSAWDSWTSDEDLERAIRRRFFSTSRAPIKSEDAAGDFPSHRNPLWTDQRGGPLLPVFAENVRVHAGQRDAPEWPGSLLAKDLSLPQRNLHRAEVTVRAAIAPGLPLFEHLPLVIRRNTTLLADVWTVADGGRIGEKLHAATVAFPTRAAIEPLARLHEPLLSIMLERRKPEAGVVHPDVVPTDRLGAYR